MKALKFPTVLALFLLAFFSGLFSCTKIHNSEKLSWLGEGNCFGVTKQFFDQQIPLSIEEQEISEYLRNNFSNRNLNMANLLGLLPFMEVYFKSLENYHAHPSIENRIEYLERYQRLSQRFEATQMEVSSVQAALHCEEDRMDQVVRYLRSKEGTKVKNLTVGYILLSTTTAIVTVIVLNDPDVADYYGLGAGLVGAALGYRILKVENKIKYNHPQNHLKEIAEGTPNSQLFPSSVWSYLNYVDGDPENPSSARGEILQKWQTLGLFAEIKPKDIPKQREKFFGDGGIYTSSELYLRASMYEQISAQINLMMTDINLLIKEFGVAQREFRD
jgi:hypothetical protein